MDVNKAKSYLKKINRLFDGIEQDNGEISKIEKDLMLSYVRDFYETFFDDKKTVIAPQPEPVAVAPKPKPQYKPAETVRIERQPTPEPKPQPRYEPKVEPKVEPKPIEFEVEMPKPKPKPQPIIEPKPVQAKVETPHFQDEIPKIKVIPKIEVPTAREIFREPVQQPKPEVPAVQSTHQPVSFDEFDVLFEAEKATDLSQKLSQSKVLNLRSAMGINERFLIQNELFGGNNALFNDAIDKLNSFDNFIQAKAYVIKELAPQNEWLDEKRLKRAKSFIKTINRRYK
ncbi:MAG: hypothetical protein ACPG19_11530 [Saprospiraceae bacterium]